MSDISDTTTEVPVEVPTEPVEADFTPNDPYAEAVTVNPDEAGDTPVSDAIGAPTQAEAEAAAPSATRTPPSNLEGDLKQVLDAIVQGQIVLPTGTAATPHVLAKEIHKLRGGDGKAPSGGAVAAAMDRWTEIGYIEVSAAPKAFVDYTDGARTQGLSALKKAHRDKLAAERASRKAAAPAPAATEAPAPAVEDAPVEAEPVEAVADETVVSGNEVAENAPF